MLREIFLWLTTPCPISARRLGYLGETIALEARARRCQAAWGPHLALSRQALLDSARLAKRRRLGVIFGSGPLHDIPLADLAPLFDELWLVDFVHPRTARHLARRYNSVKLIEYDVTGLATPILSLDGPFRHAEELLSLRQERQVLFSRMQPDWVASANILSQLPVLPRLWLEKKQPKLPSAWLDTWEWQVMERHLEELAALGQNADICLISDSRQRSYDSNGTLAEDFNMENRLPALTHGCKGRWQWELAPEGELWERGRIVHDVVACHWPARGMGKPAADMPPAEGAR